MRLTVYSERLIYVFFFFTRHFLAGTTYILERLIVRKIRYIICNHKRQPGPCGSVFGKDNRFCSESCDFFLLRCQLLSLKFTTRISTTYFIHHFFSQCDPDTLYLERL